MSSDFSATNAQRFINQSRKEINTEAKYLKKEAEKAINKTTKELENKVKALGKSINKGSSAYNKKLEFEKRRKINSLKNELKEIKATLGKAKNDNQKILEYSHNAMSKIETLNKDHALNFDLQPLKGRLTQLNAKVTVQSININKIFDSFAAEQSAAKDSVSLIITSRGANKLGGKILINEDSKDVDNLKELKKAEIRLEKVANQHAVLLEAVKPLNDLQAKLDAKRKEIESFNIPSTMKKPLLDHINSNFDKVETMRQKIRDKSIPNYSIINLLDKKSSTNEMNIIIKEATHLKSDAAKLTKETEKFVDKLSNQKQFKAAQIVNEAQKSIFETKSKLTEILAKVQENNKDLTLQINELLEKLLTLTLENKEISPKEAAHFKETVDKQLAKCDEFLFSISNQL